MKPDPAQTLTAPLLRPRQSCLGEDELLQLAAGGVGGDALALVEQHLDGCDDCRRVLAELARPMTVAGSQQRPPRQTTGTGPTLRTFATGEIVAGRFRVIRLLGRGGMGEVYEVEDEVLTTRLALKTLAIESHLDAAAFAGLKREALFARQVTHRNVCRIFDLTLHREPGPRDDPSALRELPVLTMELLTGAPLRATVAAGPLLPERAFALASQIAAGLDAAHTAGIIHRDFKADNIMLVPEPAGPRAVITDFGLARPVLTTTASNLNIAGTLGYLAPEQLEGHAATTASDIFAFAVVLFELLTGRRPFQGNSPAALVHAMLFEPTPLISQRLAGAPRAWDHVFARALHRDPRKRPSSAGELLRLLTQASPSSSSPRMSRRIALVGTLGLVAVAGVMLLRRRGRSSAASLAPVRAPQEPVRPPPALPPVAAPVAAPPIETAAVEARERPAPRRARARRKAAPAAQKKPDKRSGEQRQDPRDPQEEPDAEDLVDPYHDHRR